MDSGVATKPIADFDEYRNSLEERLNPAKKFFNIAVKKAKDSEVKIGFAKGDKPSVIAAASIFAKIGAGKPVLIGSTSAIQETAKNIGIDISDITIIDPLKYEHSDRIVKDYYEQYWRSGLTIDTARNEILKCTNRFAAAILEENEIDGLVAYSEDSYRNTVSAIADIIDLQEDYYTISSSVLLAKKDKQIIISDPILYEGNDPESLAEAVICKMKMKYISWNLVF